MIGTLEVADHLFDDPRFEADKCGPAGGHTLLMLIIHASRSGSSVFGIDVARQICRAADADAVIDSLVEYGFLSRNGQHVALIEAPELWRVA